MAGADGPGDAGGGASSSGSPLAIACVRELLGTSLLATIPAGLLWGSTTHFSLIYIHIDILKNIAESNEFISYF
jgi:hypothetical protein